MTGIVELCAGEAETGGSKCLTTVIAEGEEEERSQSAATLA
jgi:hypothetical protein